MEKSNFIIEYLSLESELKNKVQPIYLRLFFIVFCNSMVFKRHALHKTSYFKVAKDISRLHEYMRSGHKRKVYFESEEVINYHKKNFCVVNDSSNVAKNIISHFEHVHFAVLLIQADLYNHYRANIRWWVASIITLCTSLISLIILIYKFYFDTAQVVN